MTVVIGAKYPWGDLCELPPIRTNISEAIILASDSRISKTLANSSTVPISDLGAKLFPIGNDAASVYAGFSKAGELCLDELRCKLSKQTNPTSALSCQIARETFESVYRHLITSHCLSPEKAPLYILIGTCNKHGHAELISFSYSNGFKPEHITGLKMIAWPNTAKTFKKLMEKSIREKVDEELALRKRYPQIPMADWVPMPIEAGHMSIMIGAILDGIIEKGDDVTIGGPIQCALITHKGVSLPAISSTTDPTNEGPGWTQKTANRSALKTVTGVSNFGLFSLSD